MLRKHILFFALCFLSLGVVAQSSSDLKKKKDRLNKEIAVLNRSLNQTAGSKKLSQKQIAALTREIRLREEKIGTINTQIHQLDAQISTNTETVHTLKSDLARLRAGYADMLRFAARNQNSYRTLMFLFSSKDFHQAYMRARYLEQFSRYRRKQAGQIQSTQNQIEVKIDALGKDKKKKSALLDEELEEKQTLGKKKEKQAKELQQLTTQEKTLQQQLTTRKRDLLKLNSQIQAAINREIIAERRRLEAIAAAKAKAEAERIAAAKKANPSGPAPKAAAPDKPVSKTSSVLSATPESARLSASFAGNKGQLPWPVATGKVAEGFGQHTKGVNVQFYNTGIDIETSAGATVQAVFQGDVFSVTSIDDGVYLVMIRHGEYITVYSNLRSTSVSRGQKVSTRQSIGTALNGRVHFEVRKGIEPMNPTSWIAR